MLETLQFQDEELNLLEISRKEIIDSITLEDVKNFLESLGVTQIQVNEDKGYLICPTICHNPVNIAESMKLYWYQNNKIFRCYTECNEAMSIFTLYRKYMELNYYPISEVDATEYVKRCLKHINITREHREKRSDIDFNKYKFTAQLPELQEYDNHVLDCFIQYYHPQWIQEGIAPEVMKKFNIMYSISDASVVIPQKDINGRLIGIREREFEPWRIKEFGKYHPITVGNINYKFPEMFQLYGVYEHQYGIKARKTAILVEGEKSVMLDDTYYGKMSNAIAVCGCHTNKYHISLLTDILGVNEIIIAFDKEYDDWHTVEARKYRNSLEKICNTYKGRASFSYIWDYDNVLEKKDSPYDKGKEVFEHLYKNRIKVR